MNTRIVIAFAALLGASAALSAADAAANWEQHCAKCHGADGNGQTKMGKKLKIRDLTDATVQATFNDDEGFQAMKAGKKDKGGKLQMKPIEGLTDEEMQALVKYVRALKT